MNTYFYSRKILVILSADNLKKKGEHLKKAHQICIVKLFDFFFNYLSLTAKKIITYFVSKKNYIA